MIDSVDISDMASSLHFCLYRTGAGRVLVCFVMVLAGIDGFGAVTVQLTLHLRFLGVPRFLFSINLASDVHYSGQVFRSNFYRMFLCVYDTPSFRIMAKH